MSRSKSNSFKLRSAKAVASEAGSLVHIIREGVRCDTEGRGFATPKARSPLELVVNASEGFIPLWNQNVILRWRFQERSLVPFEDPDAVKKIIRELFGEGLLLWGDAVPIRFTERDDAWDFEIVVRNEDDCDPTGCVVARSFFPSSGRNDLVLYPQLFTQTRKEQIDSIAHEQGHIFGLRHFFAEIEERSWRSEIFGTHEPFSIMNYGKHSEMTEHDRGDLKRLYEMVWSGELSQINGTPIRLMTPYHDSGLLV